MKALAPARVGGVAVYRGIVVSPRPSFFFSLHLQKKKQKKSRRLDEWAGAGSVFFLLGVFGRPIILGGTSGEVVGAVNKSAFGGSGPGGVRIPPVDGPSASPSGGRSGLSGGESFPCRVFLLFFASGPKKKQNIALGVAATERLPGGAARALVALTDTLPAGLRKTHCPVEI